MSIGRGRGLDDAVERHHREAAFLADLDELGLAVVGLDREAGADDLGERGVGLRIGHVGIGAAAITGAVRAGVSRVSRISSGKVRPSPIPSSIFWRRSRAR